jgi:hypothetical protein
METLRRRVPPLIPIPPTDGWPDPRPGPAWLSFRCRTNRVEEVLMKPDQITEALEQAAAHVGVRVRYESMTGESSGAGGLCKIRGEWTVIIDRKSSPSDRASMLVEALAGFDVDGFFLAPEIREALAKRRAAMQATTGAGASAGDAAP